MRALIQQQLRRLNVHNLFHIDQVTVEVKMLHCYQHKVEHSTPQQSFVR